MKRSLLRQLFFGLVLSCSVASYVYLSTVPAHEAGQPEMGVNVVEQPEVILPDMALIQKLIDLGQSLVSLVH